MENNTQLPEAKHFLNWLSGYRNENGEYIELLKGKYYFVDEYPDDDIYHTEVTADELIELYKLHHPIEATAYATDRHRLQQENAELRRWKMEAAELLTKIHSYAHKHLEIKLGESIVDFVIARAKERDEFKLDNDRLKIALENVYRIHGHQWAEYDRNVIKELIN